MARSASFAAVLAVFLVASAEASEAQGALGVRRESSLLQTWSSALDQESGQDTPVTRVVKLLQEMHKTLKKEQEEDEELYDKMACWCSNTIYEKKEAIEKNTAKVAELESTIESLTAKRKELAQILKETEAQVAEDKKALATAQALRDKQQKEFHGMELDSIQNLENLRAAIMVLARHFNKDGGSVLPGSSVAGGAVFKTDKESWSLLSTKSLRTRKQGKSSDVWTDDMDSKRLARSMDSFLDAETPDKDYSQQLNSMPDVSPATVTEAKAQQTAEQLIQEGGSSSSGLSLADEAVVKHAYDSARGFLQTYENSGAEYYPAYAAQSGQILGILRTMEDEMNSALKAAQKLETERVIEFNSLRDAKTEAIQKGEKIAEEKEDELATTDNDLAEAKEDLGVVKKTLEEDKKFLANAQKMCDEADAAFAERKKARLSEIEAVAETIEILTTDEARDAMSGTYTLLQVTSSEARQSNRRKAAAEVLRKAAKTGKSPVLAALATSVELDAFTKVKAAIDDMIEKLKQQQEDEVKKNDWCKSEIQENEMATMKTQTAIEDLQAKIASLEATIKQLEEEIAAAQAAEAQAKVDLQSASEDRKKENYEFQTTVADQLVTIDVLKKALDRLATYYDFLQTHPGARRSALLQKHKQTPPVPQMKYAPSKGAGGVMQMIEKLIYEAKALMADSRKDEMEAEVAYEQLVADTNANVEALQKEIAVKKEAKADTKKDLANAQSDLSDEEKELKGHQEYNTEIHAECDYLLKNFDVRQEMRGNEIEALQQAKQILNGANLGL